MKKLLITFISIFTTGIFAGLFFGTGISPENRIYLCEMILSGLNDSSSGAVMHTFTVFLSEISLILLMIPALFTKYLSFFPPSVLFYKSFSLGFCCSLIYSSDIENSLYISMLRILPQNLFSVPAFISLAAIFFSLSIRRKPQKNRLLHNESRSLLFAAAVSAGLIFAGAVIDSVFRAAAL